MKLLMISLTIFMLALNASTPRTIVSITFDDGLASEYEASKILDNYGFKATFYIPAGLIGKQFENNTLMNYSSIKELHYKNHEIACHTTTHANLSSLNEETVRYELSECKNILKEFNPVSFAYPYGQGTEWEQIIKEYYTSARILNQSMNKEKGFNIKSLILVHDRMERLNTLKEWLKEKGWIVLSIHGVTNEPRGLIDITPDELIQTLNILKESGVEVLTVREAING